jgi:hypothetical protein
MVVFQLLVHRKPVAGGAISSKDIKGDTRTKGITKGKGIKQLCRCYVTMSLLCRCYVVLSRYFVIICYCPNNQTDNPYFRIFPFQTFRPKTFHIFRPISISKFSYLMIMVMEMKLVIKKLTAREWKFMLRFWIWNGSLC